jgi:predicted nucleic acid-binding protein
MESFFFGRVVPELDDRHPSEERPLRVVGEMIGDALASSRSTNPQWYAWSSAELAAAADENRLALNPIVYAEVSIGFERIEDLDEALPPETFVRLPLPWSAAFLAGKCFLSYRRAGGTRHSPLPDFYIGAHAAVERMAPLDERRGPLPVFSTAGSISPGETATTRLEASECA